MSDDEERTAADDAVISKYMQASEIANATLAKVIERCVVGASILEICEFGDNRINEEASQISKKNKEMKKGIAFPTCISVNNCVGHFSPLKSEPSPVTLKDGDLVKIELGAHIDGFAAMAAHTLVLGASATNPATGRKADVVLAAYYASEIALRLLKPDAENTAIGEAMDKAIAAFKCKAIEGWTSHQMKQGDPEKDDGTRLTLNPGEQLKKDLEKSKLELHDVLAVDIAVSTAEGKPRELETRTTVYRKQDIIYNLKMKTSRELLAEVEKRFGLYAFSLRMFEDENHAKLGVIEPMKHALMQSYPVMFEREGEYVSRFMFTVILQPNGPLVITSAPFDPAAYKSELKIEDPALQALLAQSVRKGGKKKAHKKKPAAGTGNQQSEAAKAGSSAASTPAAGGEKTAA